MVRRDALAQGRPFYIDANPFSDRHLTGIGRYTARVALALKQAGAEVRFFSIEREVVPPEGLDWSQDQDLARWGRQVWKSRMAPGLRIPKGAVGLWPCTRPAERVFPYEISVIHDFTPLIVPWTHSERTRADFQFFFGKGLLASDAALAVSHSSKADAAWQTAFDQDRILVAPSGPSICIERHLCPAPSRRRPEVGLVISTIEPRKNAFFLLDWFRDTGVLPEGAELWWVGPMGWLISRRKLRSYRRIRGRTIRFLGVVSDRRLCELYQSVGWSIYPSLYEGFGFPVLDALRHGTPVLAGAHSAIREFRSPGLFFFDPCDPGSLDLAWEHFRANRSVSIPVRDLDEQYDWGRVARMILELPDRFGTASRIAADSGPGSMLAA